MSVEIITKKDLQLFRKELLRDIQVLLGQENDSSNEWLKTAEVKKMLKISYGTLLTLRANGKLNYSKIGGTFITGNSIYKVC
jgi:hypothetical protein